MAKPSTVEAPWVPAGYMSTNQAAIYLKITGNTVRNYAKRGLIKEYKSEHGYCMYAMDEIYKLESGIILDDKQEISPPQLITNEIPTTVDARKKLAEAVKAEIQVETLKQTLIPTELVIEMLSAELSTVRARLQSLSGRIARHCIGTIAEKTAIIDAAVDEILEEIQVDMLTTRELKAQIKKRQKQSAGSSQNNFANDGAGDD